MKIYWLHKALHDLDSEADYIAAKNPQAAQRIVMRIAQAIGKLQYNYELGRVGRITGTRELIVAKTRYIIPYRIRDNRIEILRIFHTSRKLPQHW